ncbi:MAG: acylneuraminate cytidylyltransferase [Ignavibacteriaceae bacterium]
MVYVAEIPVRIGSKRVAKKNLRLICGKPLVAYSIEAVKKSKLISDIYLNSESEVFRKIADEYKIKFYKRKSVLAQDRITSDDFNYDFLKSTECDALVMINSVSPLITTKDIDNAIEYFEEGKYDTLLSVKEERLQAFYHNQPINISIKEKLAMTQNIDPVYILSWAISIWRKKTFIDYYNTNGYAVFNGKLGFFKLNSINAIKISYEEDFQLAESILKSRLYNKMDIKYYE